MCADTKGGSVATTAEQSAEQQAAEEPDTKRWHVLSANPGKRAAEIFYVVWFLCMAPVTLITTKELSFTHANDPMLVAQGVVMGAGAWFGPLIFRAREDRGKPFYEVYGFKFGFFLAIWAMVGGYLGTGPWYTVLSGHFGFNTAWNFNGVPFFFLPMSIAVFGFYTVILGVLYRLGWQWYEAHVGPEVVPPLVTRIVLILVLSVLVPLGETAVATSKYYCFDHGVTKWFWLLEILIYGAWQGSALLFYPRLDEQRGESTSLRTFAVCGFATVAILLFANQLTTEVIAPHLTHVHPGLVNVDDWSPNNCLGAKPS